jgi:hypothetical protein
MIAVLDRYGFRIVITVAVTLLIASSAYSQANMQPQTVTLLKRAVIDGVDNYTRATFSFKYGVNGDEGRKITRNNWDLLFGDSSFPDAFNVTMVTDDCSRIKDLGALEWNQYFEVKALPAYEKPTHEPGVKAVVGHMYIVHTKDRDEDHYALFRVEALESGKSVTISWRLIPADYLKFPN